MAIDLYHTNLSPPCRAVRMVAKHLNIDLNLKKLDMKNGEHLKPEFLKLNPAHCVPTIVDNGFALWESRAIMQYLCNKYAPNSDLYPKDPKDKANVDRMLNFDMTLYKSISNALFTKIFRGIEPTEADLTALKNNLKLLDTLIGGNRYVASNKLTIADLALVITVGTLVDFDYDFREYSNVKQWFDRLKNDLSYFDEINGSVKEEFKALIANMAKDNAK